MKSSNKIWSLLLSLDVHWFIGWHGIAFLLPSFIYPTPFTIHIHFSSKLYSKFSILPLGYLKNANFTTYYHHLSDWNLAWVYIPSDTWNSITGGKFQRSWPSGIRERILRAIFLFNFFASTIRDCTYLESSVWTVSDPTDPSRKFTRYLLEWYVRISWRKFQYPVRIKKGEECLA